MIQSCRSHSLRPSTRSSTESDAIVTALASHASHVTGTSDVFASAREEAQRLGQLARAPLARTRKLLRGEMLGRIEATLADDLAGAFPTRSRGAEGMIELTTLPSRS